MKDAEFTFGSVFAGAGGFDLGLERAGMTCKWQIEKDRFCLDVLSTHWPDVPKYHDVIDCGNHNLSPVSLICGGFPCTDISCGGSREGLAGKSSQLWFPMLRIFEELRSAWVLIENVQNLLYSNGGADFAAIISGLVECGYRVAWRCFDSQNFGLAQQRKRLYIVGHLGDGCAAQILFEPDCLSRYSETRTAQRSENPLGVEASLDDHCERADYTPATLTHSHGRNRPDETFVSYGFGKYKKSDVIHTIRASGGDSGRGSEALYVVPQRGIRKLMPLEHERLQGFPDHWAAMCSDTQRYRMMGNAVSIPVVEWIGRRIYALKDYELQTMS